jgi:hypothetical protein
LVETYIHVHHTTNEKYIQKVEELYFKTTTKSPRELVFARDMILNVQHTANWEYIRSFYSKNNKNNKISSPSYTYDVNDKVMMHKGTENKYEVPFNGSRKTLIMNLAKH